MIEDDAGGSGVGRDDYVSAEVLTKEGLQKLKEWKRQADDPTSKPQPKLQVDEGLLYDSSDDWSATPSLPDQEAVLPATVRYCETAVEVYDLSLPQDRERYATLTQRVLRSEIIVVSEANQQPDPGQINFRKLVTVTKKQYQRITLRRAPSGNVGP